MNFQQDTVFIGRNDCTLLVAGSGHPLLFLHGAGTWHGFDFALPWAETHRVLVPIHPNWPGSAEDPGMNSIHDYVMHYLELIDQLGLDQVDLVGLSMGGRMAAQFAAEHRRRVRKLVLVAPAGLDAPGYPLTDFSQVPPDQILSYLTEDPAGVQSHAWSAPDPREPAAFMNVFDSIMDRKFTRWLHRLTMPTMLVWGEKDRTTPIQQADEWLRYAPGMQFHRVPSAGHLILDEKPQVVEAIGKFLIA
jgi:pimeloyl-ACP methyl ester carboxylesterase